MANIDSILQRVKNSEQIRKILTSFRKMNASTSPQQPPDVATTPDPAPNPSTISKPAYQQVLGTAELLDAIFVHLPYTDLFRCKNVCKQWKASIETSPKVQQAMFLQPSDQIPCELPNDGKPWDVELKGQPLKMLSHYEGIGGLVFGGVAVDYMRWTPPLLYPSTSCWLFVRQAQYFMDMTPNEGSWRDLLLKNTGDAMDFDVVLCPDEHFLDSIKATFIGGKRTMGELVDAIRKEFEMLGLGVWWS